MSDVWCGTSCYFLVRLTYTCTIGTYSLYTIYFGIKYVQTTAARYYMFCINVSSLSEINILQYLHSEFTNPKIKIIALKILRENSVLF